jgi:hypothetical protein
MEEMQKKAIYAPTMYRAPWAKLGISRMPKIRVSPRATIAYTEPSMMPLIIV